MTYESTIKTEQEISNFLIHIEYPETGKCENVPLAAMLHVFTKSEILLGFEGKLPKQVWYSLYNKSGHTVANWKHVMKDILGDFI